MCGIATFTMLVSISSMMAASVTVIAIRYRFAYGSARAAARGPGSDTAGFSACVAIERAWLRRRDDDVHAHAGTENVPRILGAIDPDTDGNALYHLGEVPGRV